ncbi:LTA synthase family protein [Vibrio hepatarius]|uniref:LTA synthase family protein n=1 Tax=Vibrio hepatarius TaxID=171383 RepID=UPI001C0A13F9|nr:LTA synthase family protein [Vibrio hepatarius]MBU2895098.1 LTA synthase family protein [Vibrio hepatarius]
MSKTPPAMILKYVLYTTTIMICVSIFMMANSPDDYRFISYDALLRTIITLSIVIGIILTIVKLLSIYLKIEKVVLWLNSLLFGWIFVAGLFFPVSISAGMLSPEEVPININNVLFVLFFSVLYASLRLTKHQKNIDFIVAAIIFSSMLSSSYAIYKSMENTESDKPFIVSNKNNVFVIGLDGIPGSVFSEVLKNDDELSESLKDFTVFENAVSQSPATTASLIGDIYGIQDYKSLGSTIDEVKNKLKTLPIEEKILPRNIDDSYAFGYSNIESLKKISPTTIIDSQQMKSDTYDFLKYPFVRVFSSYTLNILKNIGHKILGHNSYLKKLVIGTSRDEYSLVVALDSHKGASWDKKNIANINSFDNYVNNLTVGDKKVSLRYLHFVFSHFPVDFDASCSYKSNKKLWFDNHQNEKGLYGQTQCAITKVIGFINKLKKLKIYNNSFLIFKSDHGEPASYFSKSPNKIKINNHKYWGFNRYHPFLMIKPINYSNDKINYRGELVLLNDIAKTLCEEITPELGCSDFGGVNLTKKDMDFDSPYYLYVVKDEKSSFEYTEHLSIKVQSRNVTLLQAMKNADEINLSE